MKIKKLNVILLKMKNNYIILKNYLKYEQKSYYELRNIFKIQSNKQIYIIIIYFVEFVLLQTRMQSLLAPQVSRNTIANTFQTMIQKEGIMRYINA